MQALGRENIDSFAEIVGSEGFNSWAVRHLEKARNARYTGINSNLIESVIAGFNNETLVVETFVPVVKTALTTSMRRIVTGFRLGFTTPKRVQELNYQYQIHYGFAPSKLGGFTGVADRGSLTATLNLAPYLEQLAAGSSSKGVVADIKDMILHESLHILDMQLGEELAVSLADPAHLRSVSPTGVVSFTSVVETELSMSRQQIVASLREAAAVKPNPNYGYLIEQVEGTYFNAEETFVRMMKIRRSSGTLDVTSLSLQAEGKLDAYFASGSVANDELVLKMLWQNRNADKSGSIRALFELFF
jgi:hypothetical protein